MKVFISYAYEDEEIAKRLYYDLKRAGIMPWMESEDLIVGQKRKLMIRHVIKESSYFLALLSSNSVSKRGFAQKELGTGLDIVEKFPPYGIFVIPVRLDNCKIVDERLANLKPADLSISYDTGLKDILRAMSYDTGLKDILRAMGKSDKIESTSAPHRKKPSSTLSQSYINPLCFSWLHFTDLHMGMKHQKWLWPNVREILFEDLKRLHDKCGPWDLVLFTGDLTQRGSAEEFNNVNGILDQLWMLFHKLGSDPKLVAVPGNHDLVRPDTKTPVIRLLRMWDSQQKIQSEFWNEKKSPYRKVIDKAFENYTVWWNNQPFKAYNLNTGTLPGDFSVTIEKQSSKLGILGLNTSFLQLTGDDYKGRLALHPRQFHEACFHDGPKWAKQHHACLFLTHHPPAWLYPDDMKHLNAEITAHGRFALHLCGHLHETAYRDISEGGSNPRRIWQGHSLFGLEYFGNNEIRFHGYTAGKIELCGDHGKLVFWPREARLQGGERRIVPDYSINLNIDQHTNPRIFNLLQPS